MDWTALVPIRLSGESKSRLKQTMGMDKRAQIVADMAGHVLDVLAQSAILRQSIVLAASPWDYPDVDWVKDEGRGLNGEISAFRSDFGDAPLLVIHADLPLLSLLDVTNLLTAGSRHGAALATDRAGEGTNALAIADGRPFDFQFGAGSRAKHCADHGDMAVLQRLGLSADLDTPKDLEFLRDKGFSA